MGAVHLNLPSRVFSHPASHGFCPASAIPEWGWIQKPVTGTEASWDWGWWKGEVFSWGSLFSSLQVLSCQNLADPAGKTLHTESVLYFAFYTNGTGDLFAACFLHRNLCWLLPWVWQAICVHYKHILVFSSRPRWCAYEDVCSQHAQVGEWHALYCGLGSRNGSVEPRIQVSAWLNNDGCLCSAAAFQAKVQWCWEDQDHR